MNCHLTFIAFLMVCLTGVLSHAVDTTQLSKRSYDMEIPNPGSFKLKGESGEFHFFKIRLYDRKLVGTKCFNTDGNGNCKVSGSVIINLKSDPICLKNNSSIKKMRIYDNDGNEVSELIDITKVGQNISSHRYINIYFKNGCQFIATYNYKNTIINSLYLTLKSCIKNDNKYSDSFNIIKNPVIIYMKNKVRKALFNDRNFLKNPLISIPFKIYTISSIVIDIVDYYAPLLGSNKTITKRTQQLVNKDLYWISGSKDMNAYVSLYTLSKKSEYSTSIS
ncbi:hypothetical protein PIROE2DRAFT_8548 [Piromyces sp. E2]|nr:hypothetical protein PIROE2DRAFT_8548 [Piromyces sp. E2]|eukprot:OUM64627.1 hypothetical protein PIROE2DRAFT_8548 [Piromyces sp. E2]